MRALRPRRPWRWREYRTEVIEKARQEKCACSQHTPTGVKYRGDKPRGFTVLTARPKMGRAVAGEFNSPRPSRDGSAGIHTRTPGASVRVGGSTPPDNTRLTCRSRVLRGIAFPRNCQQLLQIKIFNLRRNFVRRYSGLLNKRTDFTLGVKPRGTRPAPLVEFASVFTELDHSVHSRAKGGRASECL